MKLIFITIFFLYSCASCTKGKNKDIRQASSGITPTISAASITPIPAPVPSIFSTPPLPSETATATMTTNTTATATIIAITPGSEFDNTYTSLQNFEEDYDFYDSDSDEDSNNSNNSNSSNGSNNSNDSNDSDGATNVIGDGTELFAHFSIKEINFARTNPKEYAKSRLYADYLKQNDNGAYQDLLKRNAVGSITFNEILTRSASKYAEYLSNRFMLTHWRNGNANSRCQNEGYSTFCGENLASGTSSDRNAYVNPQLAAQVFVRQLIIDEGVRDVGHRELILDPMNVAIGIGFARKENSSLGNITVQHFGTVK